MKKYALVLFMSASILAAATPVDCNDPISAAEDTQIHAQAITAYNSRASELDIKISALSAEVTSFCALRLTFGGDLNQTMNALGLCFPEFAAEAKTFFAPKPADYSYPVCLDNIVKTAEAFSAYSELVVSITKIIDSFLEGLNESSALAREHNIDLTIEQRQEIAALSGSITNARGLSHKFTDLLAEMTLFSAQTLTCYSIISKQMLRSDVAQFNELLESMQL
ncbi:MAG: hypothetical protein WCJ92_02845 [Alphaproteobacteria bacterium]